WMKLLFALLFLYMSRFQMMTLYNHHRTIMGLDLYPVEATVRQNALLKWLFELTLVQPILFAVIFLVIQNYVGFLIAIAGGIAFNFLFISGYVKKKIVQDIKALSENYSYREGCLFLFSFLIIKISLN